MARATSPVISSADRLSFTIFLATAMHAMVLLGISFELFDSPPPSQTMEITLASFETEDEMKKADYLAQANQKGSGSLEEKALPSTDQHAQIQDSEINAVTPPPVQAAPKPMQAQENQALLTTMGKSSKIRSADELKEEEPSKEKTPEEISQLSEEIASLEAQFQRKRQEYAKRPRIHRITAASTMRDKGAYYKEAWRRKIERVGNLNYPPEARLNKVYGQLRLLVSLRPSGQLYEVKILRSSGHQVLDDAAIRIVKLAAPFSPFTDDLRDVDRLEIIRTWRFEKSNYLSSN